MREQSGGLWCGLAGVLQHPMTPPSIGMKTPNQALFGILLVALKS